MINFNKLIKINWYSLHIGDGVLFFLGERCFALALSTRLVGSHVTSVEEAYWYI